MSDYGSECWTLKAQQEKIVGVAEVRILRWMCGQTRRVMIQNDCIWGDIGVILIKEKMTENRLSF